MKCFNHIKKEAVATCVHCGKALCPACCHLTPKGRMTCSKNCQTATQLIEQTLESIRKKAAISNKASWIFCIMAGVCFGLFGLFNLFVSRYMDIGVFCLVMCAVTIVGGSMYLKAAKAS